MALEAPVRRAALCQQGRLILTLDGLQPDQGHEVLWVVREVLSGEILAARSLLVSGQEDLSSLLREALVGLEGVPVKGVISDGQQPALIGYDPVIERRRGSHEGIGRLKSHQRKIWTRWR